MKSTSHIRLILPVMLLISLVGCNTQPLTQSADDSQIDVNIRWTSYGIPHVKADDWTSLGYGFAYATATDGVCVMARDIVTVNGNLTKFFGDKFRASDVFHRAMVTDARLAEYAAAQSPRAIAFSLGYVAGYNRFLADHQGKLPASCQGQEWVRPISNADVTRLTLGVGIRYGLGRYLNDMAAAQPPTGDEAQEMQEAAALKVNDSLHEQTPLASNAVAFGREVTANGRGILFGNPHYPWSGPSRFHLIHMTLPGEIDVMGTSLLTTAGVSIGFNHDIAWSHTVSTGMRATLYELALDPADPTRYRYGDDYRAMEVREVALSNGEKAQVYFSHFGPIVEREGLPWNSSEAYAVRDANLNNFHAAATYDAMGKAKNVDDIIAALNIGGVSWVNTIAADSAGSALYADISTVPNVDAELFSQCKLADARVGRAKMVILDGSKPDCEWREDASAKIAGAMPTEVMPKLVRDDYVTNSNDSYWLSNPKAPLEGYSPIIGPERTARSLRTRAGLKYVEELIQAGPIQPDVVTSLIDTHRNFGAELLLDDLLTLCTPDRSSITKSCQVLANWDRAHRNDSRGAHIWTEIMRVLLGDSSIYRQAFDLADPVNTPAGLKVDDQDVVDKLVSAIETAQETLAKSQIALDAPLGEIQYASRGDRKIAIPGGEGWAGAFSMIVTQLSPEPGVGYSPIIHGNSIMEVVSWDDDGKVVPRGILTYSQSQESDSPHYADQTELYSRGEWIDLPFHEADIASDPNLRSLRLTE
ncbi:MAG: penicillin acylase family protein [Pseudomonadota bacterium]